VPCYEYDAMTFNFLYTDPESHSAQRYRQTTVSWQKPIIICAAARSANGDVYSPMKVDNTVEQTE